MIVLNHKAKVSKQLRKRFFAPPKFNDLTHREYRRALNATNHMHKLHARMKRQYAYIIELAKEAKELNLLELYYG